MLEQLKPKVELLVIEEENYRIVNENEVEYLLKNNFVIKVSLNLYTYDRNVSVYNENKKLIEWYQDLSKERIVEKIRMYEEF